MKPQPDTKISPEIQLLEDMARFRRDPYSFVLYAFAWGEGELADFKGPDTWQRDLLCEIRDGAISVAAAIDKVLQFSVGSGHGIGKSAIVCWLILWAMSTMEDTKGLVTANTDTQLRTKTWPELAKWHRLCVTAHWFKYTATALFSVDPAHEKTWRIDAIPWSANNPAAFAGMHNKKKRILLIFDEASEIDDIIWEVIEGALTDEDTEIFWFAFGNRTVNTGKFSQTFKGDRDVWRSRAIDSRTCNMTNKALIDRWIKKYGIDSDFVRVRVLGEEPLSNPCQMIAQELISGGRGLHLRIEQYSFAPVIISCDPAWKGGDETVIMLRQGLMSKILWSTPKNNNDVLIANKLMQFEDEYQADQVFIDLGYGTGIYSVGDTLGRTWMLVSFAGKSGKQGFLNKRAEMYGDIETWLGAGGSLPDHQLLCEELTWIETLPRMDGNIQLIDKDDMPASPNYADALALTFSYPVQKKARGIFAGRAEFTNTADYDPLAH